MRNSSFNSQMAGSAKGDKIVGAVGSVPDDETSARRNVMNIERTPALRAASTKPTFPISVEHRKPNTAPMSTKFEIASTAIIRMSWANHCLLGAQIGTKLSASHNGRSKGAEYLAAVQAGKLLRGDAACPATLIRTMTHITPRWCEHSMTDCALNWLDCIGVTPVSLTLPTAKPKLRLFLYEVVRSAECFTAICALIISIAFHHRRRVASLAAVHHSPIIGSKTFFTLEAGLVH